MSQLIWGFFKSYLDSPAVFYDTDNWSNPLACISCELLLQHWQGTLRWELFLSTTPELHFSGKGEPPAKAKPWRGSYTWKRGIHTKIWLHILQSLGAHFCLFKKTKKAKPCSWSQYIFKIHTYTYIKIHSNFFYLIAIFS